MTRNTFIYAALTSAALFALSAQAQPAPAGGDASPPPPPHAEGKPEGGKPPMMGKEERRGKRLNFLFQHMDANHDGKVSKAEHDSFSEQRFKETDSNNDNAITEEEMRIYGDKKREEHKQKMMEKRQEAAPSEAAPAAAPTSTAPAEAPKQ